MDAVVSPDERQSIPAIDPGDREWIAALRGENGSAANTDAVRRLHDTVLRAARQQVRRMPQVWAQLGSVRAEEIIHSAADDAATDVLANLDRFEGRSKFTTWVYKFGILHAGTEARRAVWRGRSVDLDQQPEPATDSASSPDAHAEAKDLSAAVAEAMSSVLTPHQRRVAHALIVDEVPIDVLAERLETTRNAVYKTLHDARVRLRAELSNRGFLTTPVGAR